MSHPTDLEAFTDPGLWPKWPALPVKHKRLRDKDGFPKVAVMLAVKELGTTVFHTNIFLIGGRKLKDIIGDDSIKRTKYDNLDALMNDWAVD